MPKQYTERTGTNGYSRPAIEDLSIDFDVPVEIASCLVGKTEQETESRIADFKNYLKSLLQRKRMWERYDFEPKVGV